jgi:hypothetical protein
MKATRDPEARGKKQYASSVQKGGLSDRLFLFVVSVMFQTKRADTARSAVRPYFDILFFAPAAIAAEQALPEEDRAFYPNMAADDSFARFETGTAVTLFARG